MWDTTIVELIDMLMVGYEMEPEDLVRLLEKGQEQEEGHYLEVKQGHPQKDKSNPRDTIRRYLSGFANSDGGILLLGVGGNWQIVGYDAPGNIDAAQWATNCIQSIAPYFLPLPRFQVMNHQDGAVLVVAAARSLNLVPVVENARQRYYIRVHDQTKTMPDWMISDLMLGRRSHPYLHISSATLAPLPKRYREKEYEYISFDLRFLIENGSLVWAQNVILGIVGWGVSTSSDRFSDYLRSYIIIQEGNSYGNGQSLGLKHRIQTAYEPFALDPFSVRFVNNSGWSIPLKHLKDFYMRTWKAAIYVIAKETPPVWYQLSLRVDSPLLKMLKDKQLSQIIEENLSIEKVSGGRPLVSWLPN